MKAIALLCGILCVAISPSSAAITEARVQAEMRKAEKNGRLLAFFFVQAYYDPHCPKCIVDVDSNNNAMKKALPRKYVNVLTIDAGETKGLDKLPACVTKDAGRKPTIVVTDAAGTKVIATISGRPDRKQASEFEEKVAAALGKK